MAGRTKLGKLRSYWLGAVVCMGGLLFGYDTGIVGGTITLHSFQRDYGFSSSNETTASSLTVGLQQLGAWVACMAAWPLIDRYGRRYSLMASSLVFCIGAAIQTINTGSLPAFYVARLVAGLGLGASTVVTPMFNSEMMPKEMRGQVGSFFQWFFAFGTFVSYWIVYAVSTRVSESGPTQWQIPIGLQILPAALLGLGMFTVPESTRWLTKKGRHEEAWESLKWIRADDSQVVVDEMEEIRLGVEHESRQMEGFQLKELLQGDNLKRVVVAFGVFTGQQAVGATAFAYFAPQYFGLLVGDDARLKLLITGFYGAAKIIACATFIIWFAERLARRQVLVGGAMFMSACQITTAVVVATTPSPDPAGSVRASSIATVLLIYFFTMAHNFSWGPLPWPYVSEIFPARIREPGIAIGVSAQWLWNFVFSLTTPYMINSMAWGTFLLWGCFDLIIAGTAFFFLKETRGQSLEAIATDRYKRGERSADSDPTTKNSDLDASESRVSRVEER